MTVVEAAIEADAVQRWLATRVADLELPLAISPISGGHSNLTFGLRDGAGREWVLRRPPLGHTVETAHDMAREHRVQAALQESIPVPRMVGLATDVLDVAFYVMERVDGIVVRDPADAEALTVERREALGLRLVDALAALHRVEPEAVGLGDYGRPDGYVERQLRRWRRQWEAVGGRTMPVYDELHARLSASVPAQQRAAIVHGDFRLDNVILGADDEILAILDWELSTLGDPLADLATMVAYWGDVGAGAPPPTSVAGFGSADEVIARYAGPSGLDVTAMPWYLAFAHWRLGCIAEGVYVRFRDGSMGDSPFTLDVLGAQSALRAEAALAALERA